MIKSIKNILIILVAFFLLTGCNLLKKEEVVKHQYEDLLKEITIGNTTGITEYTIYGKHFNLKGDLNNISNSNLQLVLKSEEQELVYDLFIENDTFKTNQYINRGILLENIPIGNYLVLLKQVLDEEVTYYNLINQTTYSDLEYYTMTRNNKNNKITIKYDTFNDYNYLCLEVKEQSLPNNIYDIVIDPGHGGTDSGAINGKYQEGDINLEYALMLKEALEDVGLKVKLTRKSDETLKHYGIGSRTGIPYETKAKLMLSLHLNSGKKNANGVEVYIASGDDVYLASSIANNIVNIANTKYSNNGSSRITKGVYSRVYEDSDIESAYESALEDGYIPYEIQSDTTYYYFIRETGGIITKAFSDGRNPNFDANIYYNSNYGTEAYLIELGYISNNDNLLNLLNKKEEYVKAIKESVVFYLNDGIEIEDNKE